MTAKGIWLNEGQFIKFAEPRARLTDQIATRDRSIDYLGLNFILPNPDPILKARGQDIKIYRDLRADAHVGGCVRRRKSAVKALEWGLDRGKAKSRVARNIESIFADLQLDRIIGDILEASLYGYQPLEITWAKVGGIVVPVDLQGKPPEWFCYTTDNQLRFKTRQKPWEGEAVPDRKFIVARQEPTYANPYGVPDLAMCFWPLVFKKGGVKFWMGFAEKYGTPWAVGKLPRGTPQGDIDALADQLEAMIQDAVGVIPDDGSVEIVEAAGKSASADLYERLVMWCRSEVSIALTGTNQTVEANSNRASATAGLEVADDLRDGDAGIVAEALNQLIRWTCEINWGGTDRPAFSLWDQEAQDIMQANRDKTVTEAGAKLTPAYFQRAYRYQEGDVVPDAAPPHVPGATGPMFAEGTPVITDQAAIDDALNAIPPETMQAMMDQAIGKLIADIEAAGSFDAALALLAERYPSMSMAKLEALLAKAMFAAELWGAGTAQE